MEKEVLQKILEQNFNKIMTSSIGITKRKKLKNQLNIEFRRKIPFVKQTKDQQLLTLRERSYKAIRDYLVACGWKELDPFDNMAHNWGQVEDPTSGAYYPIDYAYILQWQRDITKYSSVDKL